MAAYHTPLKVIHPKALIHTEIIRQYEKGSSSPTCILPWVISP